MTKEQAVALYDSQWWIGKSDKEIALFQINEPLLCTPFSVFQKAVETLLDRPVFTHEFAEPQSLINEYERKLLKESSYAE